MIISSEQYLEHYGRRGMKWYQHIFGSKDERAAYNRMMGYTDREPNERVMLGKGTELYRVSVKTQDDNIANMYMSWTEADRDYYKASWTDFLKKQPDNKGAKVYEQKLVANNDLIGPSLEERKNIAQEILMKDNKAKQEMGKAWMKDYMAQYNDIPLSKDWKEEIRNTAIGSKKEIESVIKELEDYTDNYVENLTKSQTDKDFCLRRVAGSLHSSDYMMKTYTNELRKRGFNCVSDDHGLTTSATSRFGAEPLIIFDASKNTKYVGATEVTKQDERESALGYNKWYQKRGKDVPSYMAH